MRRNVVFLVVTLVVVVGVFLVTLAGGHEPVLGLDLQGGVSVVLSPVGKYKSDSLDVAIDIIRNRVDSFGTLEPEITRQGNDIVIDLPGVKDRDKAVALVGKTAELRFRPVLAQLPSEAAQAKAATTTTTTTAPGGYHHDDDAPAEHRRRGEGRHRDVRRRHRVHPHDHPHDDAAPTTQRNACVVLPNKPGGKNAPRYYLGKAGPHRQGR